MKITSETTLGQLAIERARLGITRLSLRSDHARIGSIIAFVETSAGVFFGEGATDADAIDAAFARCENRLGQILARTGALQ